MSLKKNFIYNVLYQFLLIIIPLITTPYIARIIGPEGVGVQSYTISIANYFVLFAMLGVNNYGSRTIAQVRDDKRKLNESFLGIYYLQAIMAVFVMIVYVIYITIFASDYKIIFLVQGIYIVASLLDVNWYFFGKEQFKITIIRSSIIKIITVISIFIFVKESSDIYKYSLILALGNLLSQLILWIFIRKEIKLTKIPCKYIYKHLKPNIVLFIPVIAVSIYKIMDKIMLGSMSNITQVGFYENAEKIINIPVVIMVALGTVMLPRISNLQANGQCGKSKKYMRLSMEFMMFISFGAMFGLMGVSSILVPVFLGNDFVECIPIVILLAVTLPFLAWANVIRTQFLIPNQKDKIYIMSTVIGAGVNFISNLILIRKYGATGATIGTILAEISVCIYQSIKVRKELELYNYFTKILFYIIPGIIMYSIVIYIGEKFGVSIITGVIQIFIGGLVYIFISLLYMIKCKNVLIINIIKQLCAKLKKK